MICKFCGNVVSENEAVCPSCGGNLKEDGASPGKIASKIVMSDKTGFERPPMVPNKKSFSLMVFFIGGLGLLFLFNAVYCYKEEKSDFIIGISVGIGLILWCTAMLIEIIVEIKSTLVNSFKLKTIEMQNDFDDKLRIQVIGFLDEYIEASIANQQKTLEVDLLVFDDSKNRSGVLSISCLFYEPDRQLCIIQDHYKNQGYNVTVNYDQSRSAATFSVNL